MIYVAFWVENKNKFYQIINHYEIERQFYIVLDPNNPNAVRDGCIFFFLLLHYFLNICSTIICKHLKGKSHNVVTKLPKTIPPRHKRRGATTLLQSLNYNCQSD